MKVLRLKSAVSTQTRARRMADAGAAAWTAIRADRQTRGRGRMDRRWSSGAGGLYFSLVLRPRISPRRLAALSVKIGKICSKTLGRLSGLKTRVKLPNDVLAAAPGSREYRKVCGVLIEASGCAHETEWVIVGIGVNVANRIPDSLPHASSLALLSREKFDLDAVFAALVKALKSGLKSP